MIGPENQVMDNKHMIHDFKMSKHMDLLRLVASGEDDGSWCQSCTGSHVFVLQGILLEHREKEFGDKAHLAAVRTAVRRIQKTQETQHH